MRILSISTFAIGLAFSTGVMAESMSKEKYKSNEKSIGAEYKAEMTGCNSLAGNPNVICVAEAKGKKNIAKAELEADYKPTNKSRYDARIAKADADYSVAIVKCEDKTGNDKNVCVKEAKAAKAHEIADVKAQMKILKAEAMTNAKAPKKVADADKDVAADKHDADYAVAEEECEDLAGDIMDMYISYAKVRIVQQ